MKKILNILTVCVLTICFAGPAYAQEPLQSPRKDGVSIGNTKISRDDKDLVVDYQIMLGDNVLSCNVEVVMLVGRQTEKRIVLGASELKGDFGRITESGFKQVRFNVEKDSHYLAGKDIRFTLNVKSKNVLDNEILAMASVSVVPQPSYGLMLGYVKKFGGYAKFRSDFHFGPASYTCNRSGEIDGGGLLWANGQQRKSRLQATGGVLFRLTKWCYPYVGAGYGTRSVQWQDYQGQWAEVADYSCKGIAAEAGVILKMGPVAVSAGYSSTAFKYSEIELGIGVMF